MDTDPTVYSKYIGITNVISMTIVGWLNKVHLLKPVTTVKKVVLTQMNTYYLKQICIYIWIPYLDRRETG